MKTYLYAFLLAAPALGFAQAPAPTPSAAAARPGAEAPDARGNAFARAATTASKPAPTSSAPVAVEEKSTKGSPFGGPGGVRASSAASKRPTKFAAPMPDVKPAASAPSPTPVTPSPPPQPEQLVEEVPAIRLGRVNGEYIYRGTSQSTYLFEEVKTRKVLRRPASSVTTSAVTASAGQDRALNPGSAPNLPSTVGQPNPADARPAPAPTARPANRPGASRPGPASRTSSRPTSGAPAPDAEASNDKKPVSQPASSPAKK